MQLQFFLVPSHFIQLHYPLYLSCLSYIVSPPNQNHTTYTHFFFRIDKQIDYQFSFFLKKRKRKKSKKRGTKHRHSKTQYITFIYTPGDTTQDRRGWVNQYVNMEKYGEIGKCVVWVAMDTCFQSLDFGLSNSDERRETREEEQTRISADSANLKE